MINFIDSLSVNTIVNVLSTASPIVGLLVHIKKSLSNRFETIEKDLKEQRCMFESFKKIEDLRWDKVEIMVDDIRDDINRIKYK